MTDQDKQNFIDAYKTTALWSETRHDETEDTDTPLDNDFDNDDIDNETAADMASDCDKFLNDAAAIIDKAIETGDVVCGPDFDEWGRAGHDFWLTRNRHGCGFWDGDWPEPFGKQLTDLAHKFGEYNLYATPENTVAKM